MDKKEFKFEQVGKQMPYVVPEGAFDSITSSVLDRVDRQKPKGRRLRHVLWGSAAAAAMVAASVAVMLVAGTGPFAKPSSDWSDVDQAFAHLSPSDQAYLIEAYQEDVFLDGQSGEGQY